MTCQMQVDTRGLAMNNFNHVNSLYFYPHTLRFSPAADAADTEQRNRWFPSYKASTAQPRGPAPVAQAMRATERDSHSSDKTPQEADDARMDDDGAPIQATPRELAHG